MLAEFNEGRSKSFYCIVATVLDIQEITQAIAMAKNKSVGKDMRSRSKDLHMVLDRIAEQRNCSLKLRK
jgi:hypothetical protein